MKKIKFKYYLALVVAIVLVMGLFNSVLLKPHNNNNEEVFVAVNKFSTTKPSDIEILYNEKLNDNRENIKLFSFTLLSKENIVISNSPPLDVSVKTALNVMRVSLKDYNFSEPIGKNAISYRWIDKDHQWSMTIVKTSVGFYSHWEMLTEL